MLKKIGIGLAAAIGIFLVVVALQPSAFRIERSVEINAPAAVVFPFVNDLHAFDSWSPWAKLDPNMKKSHSGAPKGKGAVYEWAGNDKVGSGRMEITDVKENAQVTIKLDFITPFEASNVADHTLTAKGTSTTVTWGMSGKNNFMSKAFCLFMDMDKMVGADFEKGLAELKTLAEAQKGAEATKPAEAPKPADAPKTADPLTGSR